MWILSREVGMDLLLHVGLIGRPSLLVLLVRRTRQAHVIFHVVERVGCTRATANESFLAAMLVVLDCGAERGGLDVCIGYVLVEQMRRIISSRNVAKQWLEVLAVQVLRGRNRD